MLTKIDGYNRMLLSCSISGEVFIDSVLSMKDSIHSLPLPPPLALKKMKIKRNIKRLPSSDRSKFVQQPEVPIKLIPLIGLTEQRMEETVNLINVRDKVVELHVEESITPAPHTTADDLVSAKRNADTKLIRHRANMQERFDLMTKHNEIARKHKEAYTQMYSELSKLVEESSECHRRFLEVNTLPDIPQ